MRRNLGAAILIAALTLTTAISPAQAGKWGKHHHRPHHRHHHHGPRCHHSDGDAWAVFACGMAALVGLAVLDSALESQATPAYRTVTRQEWVPAREVPCTERRWVTTYGGRGHYEEYTTTRWVPGHYETVTVRELVR